jgi:putative Mg2+ transporter-C (MgtC) family protein
MSHGDFHLFVLVLCGSAVAFVFGFERQLRGSPAGDRTFALVGASATAVAAVAGTVAPQAVAGVMTGLGFIGAGVIVHQTGLVRGITTAASIFAVAAIGIVIGFDHVLLGLMLAALLLFVLELQHIPGLQRLDSQNYANRFANDRVFTDTGTPVETTTTPPPPALPQGGDEEV